jgi:hypothetical protein
MEELVGLIFMLLIGVVLFAVGLVLFIYVGLPLLFFAVCTRGAPKLVLLALWALTAFLFYCDWHLLGEHGLYGWSWNHSWDFIYSLFGVPRGSRRWPYSQESYQLCMLLYNAYKQHILPSLVIIPPLTRFVLYPLLSFAVWVYYTPRIRIPTGGRDINEQKVIRQLYRPSRWLPWKVDSRIKVERLQWLTERLRQETGLMDQVKAYKKKRKENS